MILGLWMLQTHARLVVKLVVFAPIRDTSVFQKYFVIACVCSIWSSEVILKVISSWRQVANPHIWIAPATEKVFIDTAAPDQEANIIGEKLYNQHFILKTYAWTLDLALQRGESESRQIAIRVPEYMDTTFLKLSVSLDDGLEIEWYKVVSVWCNKSDIYPNGSKPGWHPDILLPGATYFPGLVPLEGPNVTHSILIKATAPLVTTPGKYNGNVTLSFYQDDTQNNGPMLIQVIPVSLTVFNSSVPPLNESLGTVFNFQYQDNKDGATDVVFYFVYCDYA